MSSPEHSRFDELLSRYLDASLEGAEEQELLQCLSDEGLAARFHEMTRLDAEIEGLLAGSIDDAVMVGLVLSDLTKIEAPSPAAGAAPRRAATPVPLVVRGRPRKQRTGALLALAAVAVGVLGLTALYCFRTPPPATRTAASTATTAATPAAVEPAAPTAVEPAAPTAAPGTTASTASAQIASVRGEVYFIGPAGQVSLGGGQPLEAEGTIKTVGVDSRATLVLADGTEIALAGNTAFSVGSEAGQRRLFLDAGALRSTVTKQPEDTPLVFRTADAEATVRGTELALVKEKEGTYLIVTRGAVALRRPENGHEVLVNAGYYAHVEPDGNFNPWPIARLPRAVREQALLEK